MLHVPALPGAPANRDSLDAIRSKVLRDARALAEGGVDSLIIENFGDVPFYPRRVPPHTIAYMAVIGREIAAAVPLPIGVNVLRNDGMGALAVASAIGAAFVRINVYTGARLTDQGLIEGEAHRIQRYRRFLGAQVQVFADVAVKHSATLAPRPLPEEIEDTIARGMADAIIVSGVATGKEAALADVKLAKRCAKNTPVLVGSGVNASNVAAMLACADGCIVGTAFKNDGRTTNPVDPHRVQEFIGAARKARSG